MAAPKKHYLTILLLFLFTLFIFSHYPYSTPLSPSSQKTHFLPPQKFTFTIKVLAYNRLSSLTRCLTSLSKSHYYGDTVNLHIIIDHFKNSTDVGPELGNVKKMLEFVDGFGWGFGEKMVHYRSVNVGLQGQWLEAWWPSSDDEFVFVVEDDIEVSPLYYKLLRRLILGYYYDRQNFSPWVFGASLQRPRFVPGKHGNKMNLDSSTRLFLYPLVGTWGQLLFPRPWKEFRLWYDDNKARGIKPFLEGMVTNGWYKKMGERIWTPWFIKFIHSRGYYNIYTNFPHDRALSVSHRDAGVNYGKTAGPDSQLLDESSHDIDLLDMPPLSNMLWYDFCFRKVLPGRVARKLDEVGPILQTMGKQKPVLLVSLLKVSEEIVRNLICHFERLNIQNYIFMVPNSESSLLLELTRRGHPVIDTEQLFDSIIRSKKSSPELVKEMVVKSYVVKKCLDSGFDISVISGNMLLLSDNPLLDSTDDFYYVTGSKLFTARSSPSSRQIWDGSFVRKFSVVAESLVSQHSSSRETLDFVDAVEKFSDKHGLRFKSIDETGLSLKLEKVGVNQSVPANTKMISWSPETEIDLVRKHLDRLGMWITDGDSSCKAVICHQS